MITQFTVENYRSIRDSVTLDMQATSDRSHKDSLIHSGLNEEILPLAVVYGPNGGGKSNVLSALGALHQKVMSPIAIALNENSINFEEWLRFGYKIAPFAFSQENLDKPTTFQIYFQTNTAEYQYVLSVHDDIIVYEKLQRVKFETRRISELFERKVNSVSLKGDFKNLKVSVNLSSTMPLLSYLGLTYRENSIVNNIIEWFLKLQFCNYGILLGEIKIAVAKDGAPKKLVLDMMKEMDIDIDDFRIEKSPKNFEIYTKHKLGDMSKELTLNDESSGTRKLFSLLPLVAQTLTIGGVLIVDELDAKLHPVLLRYLISLFRNPKTSKRHAQLIFTSHDLLTMNAKMFRKDEIWFVAKGEQQNSVLYSLSDFDMEDSKSTTYDQEYLMGKYGADPYLRKIIDWSYDNHD